MNTVFQAMFRSNAKAARLGCMGALALGLSLPVWAAKGHTPEQIAKDVERHKAMAAAHTAAAQCLEKNGKDPKTSGKAYDDCMKQLQTACKGLGIGKQCGMRHEH